MKKQVETLTSAANLVQAMEAGSDPPRGGQSRHRRSSSSPLMRGQPAAQRASPTYRRRRAKVVGQEASRSRGRGDATGRQTDRPTEQTPQTRKRVEARRATNTAGGCLLTAPEGSNQQRLTGVSKTRAGRRPKRPS
ncbi:hypothetical protein BKA81DRAFT_377691 [Phyllosticta paracitricarpa]